METRLKWLTQIFVDCNRFNKGESNEVLNGPLKEYSNKRCKDETRTELTETTLMTQQVFTQIRQNMKIRCNRTYISSEAIVLKLILRFCNNLAALLHQVT